MFILASSSKRRIEILSRYIKFENITYPIEENNLDYMNSHQLAMSLAFEKAIEVSYRHPDDIVLAADTVVDCKGHIIGKPKDRQDAFNILKELSGSFHKVITGYCLLNQNKNIKYCDYEESRVHFIDLDDQMINDYLDKAEYLDKAGAYGIQEEGGGFVKEIENDFDNIVGLPIKKISKDIKRLFDIDIMEDSIGSE